MKFETIKSDYLIIGSGLAGLTSAFYASKYGSVNLITKNKFRLSSTYWAQGGIAAAIGENDSHELHFLDTLKAGGNFCDEEAVKILTKEGVERVNDLIKLGMEFDRKDGKIHLGLEGGHCQRRILHAGGDATGSKVVDFFSEKINAKNNINIFQNTFAIELLSDGESCYGANVFDWENKKQLIFKSNVTILATGGGSGIYSRTTNPYTSTGDGISLAYKAGAEIQDMEFIQFHPTAFYSDSGETFLLSEAIRGEGAFLKNGDGERFMIGIHQEKELAPRDIVSKAIFLEIQKSKYNAVFLDLLHLDQKRIKSRFNNIYNKALEFNIDITKKIIPVAPAAHYMIGGVKTDLMGRTNIKGLLACGEITSTGVHGANRLASNSLLECLVFGKRVVDAGVKLQKSINESNSKQLELSKYRIDNSNMNRFVDIKNNIARLLNSKVGIIRNSNELTEVLKSVLEIRDKIDLNEYEFYNHRMESLIEISELIIKSALQREESRGTHQRIDFPELDKKQNKRIVFSKRVN